MTRDLKLHRRGVYYPPRIALVVLLAVWAQHSKHSGRFPRLSAPPLSDTLANIHLALP
jgi:hypothetical protein